MPQAFMVRKHREPDVKRPTLKSLKAIEDHISTEASESEMLAIEVAREMVSKASEAEIKDTIRAVKDRQSL
jgi:hypothetical protein